MKNGLNKTSPSSKTEHLEVMLAFKTLWKSSATRDMLRNVIYPSRNL